MKLLPCDCVLPHTSSNPATSPPPPPAHQPLPNGGSGSLCPAGSLRVAALNWNSVRCGPAVLMAESTMKAPSGGKVITFCSRPPSTSMTCNGVGGRQGGGMLSWWGLRAGPAAESSVLCKGGTGERQHTVALHGRAHLEHIPSRCAKQPGVLEDPQRLLLGGPQQPAGR